LYTFFWFSWKDTQLIEYIEEELLQEVMFKSTDESANTGRQLHLECFFDVNSVLGGLILCSAPFE
jgi:hypothetical protein